jgi:hypothetical protein
MDTEALDECAVEELPSPEHILLCHRLSAALVAFLAVESDLYVDDPEFDENEICGANDCGAAVDVGTR